VLSVTFNDPQARSKAEPEYGWRVTPYAYLLLKPKGPQVDRIPPLQLDLDFLDTSGYAIVPVETAAVPIDARDADGEERPFEKLTITQTLDERQAKDKKLLLEVKATALGLVPALETILDLAPPGFDVAQREDHGVSVVKFDESGAAMVTERTWTVGLRAKEGLTQLPDTFTFGTPRIETASNERFRYVDADLATVEATIPLEHKYGQAKKSVWWWAGPLGVIVVAGAYVAWRRTRKREAVSTARFRVPETLTPFTVIGLLREIESKNGLAPEQRRQLDVDVGAIEQHFFGDESGAAPDLGRIAQQWVSRAS
jgi:hypothetical protein